MKALGNSKGRMGTHEKIPTHFVTSKPKSVGVKKQMLKLIVFIYMYNYKYYPNVGFFNHAYYIIFQLPYFLIF